ncbi:MAG: hypothetical protein AAFZ15_06140 [Bacteroidota bacterium]
MKNFLSLSLVSFLFFACQTDQQIQDTFAGEYEVTLESPETEKETKKAKKDMRKDIDKAKEEIRDEIDKAKKEIEKELGEDSDFGKAISSFVEGMGHLAEGMTDLGESLGELGIDLGTNILENVRFRAEFQSDGEVVFGKRSRISFRSNDLRWKIKNGKMIMWDAEEDNEENAEVFEIVKNSKNEIDLVGEDIIFHLKKENLN